MYNPSIEQYFHAPYDVVDVSAFVIYIVQCMYDIDCNVNCHGKSDPVLLIHDKPHSYITFEAKVPDHESISFKTHKDFLTEDPDAYDIVYNNVIILCAKLIEKLNLSPKEESGPSLRLKQEMDEKIKEFKLGLKSLLL